MEKLFSVQENFSETVARYVSRESGLGKDPIRTMNRIMSMWLLNAMKAVVGKKSSREQIQAYMMRKIRDTPMPATRRKRAAVVGEMRNTMAMMVALKHNVKGIRQARGSEGYKIARGVKNSAVFSSGYLKSGFLPGLRARHGKTDGSPMPRYRKPAGDSPPPEIGPNEIKMMVTNFAGMIGELFPGAFEAGALETSKRLSDFLIEDALKAQRDAGLNAKRA